MKEFKEEIDKYELALAICEPENCHPDNVPLEEEDNAIELLIIEIGLINNWC